MGQKKARYIERKLPKLSFWGRTNSWAFYKLELTRVVFHVTSHFIKSRFFLPQTPWIKERCVLCDLYVAEFGTFHTWSGTIPEGSGLASLLFIKTSAYLFSHEPLKKASLWESSMSKDHLKGSNLKGVYSIFKCIYLNTRRKLWVDTPHTIDVGHLRWVGENKGGICF